MAGRFFGAWQVGDRIDHDIRRTVTETDNLLFSTMTHNPQPLHIDLEVAKPGGGTLKLNGRMIDAPHLKAARKLLGTVRPLGARDMECSSTTGFGVGIFRYLTKHLHCHNLLRRGRASSS